jgi:CBS domain containing-hemolysin-like protein
VSFTAMVKLAVLAALALASLGLACVEAAFYLLKRRRLGHLSLQNPRAELVNRYLEDPPLLLMPVHMGTYTAHMSMALVIASLFLELDARWALVVAFLSMMIYLLVFRLTVPYALVRRNPERSLLVLLPAFHAYARALKPLVSILRRRAAPETEKEAEVPTAVPNREIPPPPVQDTNEGRLVDALARFAETLVREVMTPRPDIVAIGADRTLRELRDLMRETKYSRVVVFGENLDDVVGVVEVRDIIDYDGDADLPIRPLVRTVPVVPATKRIADLLRELQQQHTTFAVVVDEYGGTAGLVTVEDIVEELVGEIKDEFDVETDPIAVEPDGSVLVAGRVNVDRLEVALEASLAQDDEVGTVGGFVTALFGRVPRTGERMEYRGFEVEVVDAERKRVNRVRFRRIAVANRA